MIDPYTFKKNIYICHTQSQNKILRHHHQSNNNNNNHVRAFLPLAQAPSCSGNNNVRASVRLHHQWQQRLLGTLQNPGIWHKRPCISLPQSTASDNNNIHGFSSSVLGVSLKEIASTELAPKAFALKVFISTAQHRSKRVNSQESVMMKALILVFRLIMSSQVKSSDRLRLLIIIPSRSQ